MDKILGKEEKREKGIRGKHGKNGIHKERGKQIRGGKREIKTAQREIERRNTHRDAAVTIDAKQPRYFLGGRTIFTNVLISQEMNETILHL